MEQSDLDDKSLASSFDEYSNNLLDIKKESLKHKTFRMIYSINQSCSLPIFLETILLYGQYVQFIFIAPAAFNDA